MPWLRTWTFWYPRPLPVTFSLFSAMALLEAGNLLPANWAELSLFNAEWLTSKHSISRTTLLKTVLGQQLRPMQHSSGSVFTWIEDGNLGLSEPIICQIGKAEKAKPKQGLNTITKRLPRRQLKQEFISN